MKNFTYGPYLVVKNHDLKGSKKIQRSGSRACYVNYVLLVFLIMTTSSIFSQSNIQGPVFVNTPAGGFAVDGDAYAGVPSPTYSALGDWFNYGTNPGGIFPSTINFSLVDPDGDSSQWPYPNTYFFRDDITNMDPTIFTSSNKINDNPNSYTWGVGSSPNKNEIQNAMAHFTYDANDNLWVLFAADREVTSGSSYIDFEFLQNTLNKTGTTSGSFTTEGPHGGRTLGDILLTIEFTQGGVTADVVVQRWEAVGGTYAYVPYLQPAGEIVLFGTNNTAPITVPYPLYNQRPVPGGGYQYAINQWAEGAANLSALFDFDPCFNISTLFVRTRTSGSSGQSELKDFPGGPVQLELDLNPEAGLTATPACEGEDVIFTATPLNATDYTFFIDAGDKNGTYDAGEEVQTGISNTYTTSTLSHGDVVYVQVTTSSVCTDVDSAAAVIYNNPVPTAQNLEDCEAGTTGSATFNLADGLVSADGGTVTYYASQANADAAINPLTAAGFAVSIADSPKAIYVRSDNGSDGDEGCYGTTSFTITVYDNPVPTAQNLEDCEAGTTGSATFNLADGLVSANGGTVTYYASQANADAATNPLTAAGFAVSIADSPKTIYVRSDNGSDGDEGCYGTTSFTITVYDNPVPTAQNLEDCEAGTTGSATFNLADGLVSADGGTVTYYASQANADAATNPLTAAGFAVSIADSPKTIYVRSDNGSDGDEGCYGTTSFTITVYDNPVPTAQNLEDCEAGTTGSATFNLADGLVSANGGTVTYYASQANADAATNPLTAAGFAVSIADSPKTIYVRSDNGSDGDEGCYGTTSFTITVYDNPVPTAQNLEDCEAGTTGSATFNLADGLVSANGGTVTYYASQANADAATNPLTAAGFAVSIADSPKTIYVRSDNGSDGDEGCYGTTSFTITVYDNPVPTAQNLEDCEAGTTGSATFNLADGLVSADGGTVTYYASQANADAATNPLTAAGFAVSIADSPKTIYVRSDNGSDGDEGCYGTTSFTITVYDNPVPTAQNLEDCEAGTTGSATFNLADGLVSANGGTVTYYASQANADAATNPLTAAGFAVSIADSPKTIYVRSDNGSDGDEGCYGTTSFTITVYDNPVPTAQNLEDCEAGTTGSATFNLADGLVSADGGTVTYYASQANADAATNPLTAAGFAVSIADSPKTIYVRSDNGSDGDEGCYGTTSFTITVYDNPVPTAQNLEDCEAGTTGSATFNLADGLVSANGGTVTYYASQANADAATNPLTAAGFAVSIADSPKTIYVRSDNGSDGDEGCYGTTSFTITVYDNPDLIDATVCVNQTVNMGIGSGTYSSSNTSVATVDANGVVSGISVGSATITYTALNGCSDTATITVQNCIVDEGCTPGYWKNHTEAWMGAEPTDNFFIHFGIDYIGKNVQDITTECDLDHNGQLTLLEAISAEVKTSKNNGWFAALARHAVAAFLNASNPEVGYEFSTWYILEQTRIVFETDYKSVNQANAAAQTLHNLFRRANERVCPLGAETRNALADTSVIQPSESTIIVQEEESLLNSTVVSDFNVSPVPFRESLSVQYDFDYVSSATIQIFDMQGRLLLTQKEANASKGKITDLNINFRILPSQVYVIKVTTDRDVFTKKIVSSK